MQLDIKYEEGPNKERRFFCPNTMSPVSLQLSVYQVGTLLKSLQLAFDSEVSYNSLYMALNAWSQLTDYCKERVKGLVRPGDEDFKSFLEMIENTESGQPFMTEIEMFDDENIEGKLNLAFKGSHRCNVKIHGKVMRDCTIKYDFSHYIIHHDGKQTKVIPSEIEDIVLLEREYM